MTKVIIVDDHPLMAQATKELLEQMEQIHVAGMAGDGTECMDLIKLHKPEIVFLDFHLPDQFGDAIAKQIKTSYPHIHIVIFTGIDVKDLFNHFIELGVSGILSKESDTETIKQMVGSILRNQTIIPLPLFHQMRLAIGLSPAEQLTDSEKKMMDMVVEGYTNEKIADTIHMSKRSVDNYLKKIYQKLAVKTRAQAVSHYIESNQGPVRKK